MRYQRWSRCAAAPQSAVCPCRRRPRGLCRRAAICTDSPSRRRGRSRSEERRSVKTTVSASRRRRRTHIDHPGRVASAQVVQHGRLVEVRQHGHVFDHVVLGRVHLLDVAVLYRQSLLTDTRGDVSLRTPSLRRNFRETLTYPPVFGFHDDFVTFELLDLNLDVRLFVVRDPGSFLP